MNMAITCNSQAKYKICLGLLLLLVATTILHARPSDTMRSLEQRFPPL